MDRMRRHQPVNRVFRAILFAVLGLFAVTAAAAAGPDVQTAWRLLDYLAVDYGGAVSGGKVASASEYAEMREFSASVHDRVGALPANPAKAQLLASAARLQAAIERKAAPPEVARLARTLGSDLLRAYPVTMGPPGAPDAVRGAQLYSQNCASCHGLNGDAKTAIAQHLKPPPITFADRVRAADRTPFALYQVIDQGLEGTAMVSFANLSAADKWALAFHAGRFAYPASLAAKGKAIWDHDASLKTLVPNLDGLSGTSENALAQQIGPDRAGAVIAYLRADPAAVSASASAAAQPTLALARKRLQASLAAYERGDQAKAKDLALSAYLDGFEPVEGALGARDPALLARVEQGMGELRAAIARGDDAADVRSRVAAIDAEFAAAERALAPDQANDASTFLGAFTILLREGLEALLVAVAMIAFLRKADRAEALAYVHGGWVAALTAGAATWAIATYAIGISGASRELTEGFGSLLAAVILLSVGIWMHGKSQAEEWRRYIRDKMQGALSKGSAWFLFGLAFIVVYREVFETILFYAALWTPDNGTTILAGALSAVAMLAIIAWAMLRYSRSLPITEFFRYSAILIAILTVVLAGKGVGALQEAGIIGITPLGWVPRIAVLGLFPTMESLATQIAMLIAVIWGFRSATRRHPHPMPAE
ncbi:cytochrome c/FTR1 family iron permease [Sphingomonas sp.]|uniref:cytochrome c/FTR1 family iron permease n=1 Tax=Sphingomonas sp. TaxID=28214 RepID=UPI00286C48FB|nr:cytochrome c/FTR1 family iron permease [Sphingomonas sp.]